MVIFGELGPTPVSGVKHDIVVGVSEGQQSQVSQIQTPYAQRTSMTRSFTTFKHHLGALGPEVVIFGDPSPNQSQGSNMLLSWE